MNKILVILILFSVSLLQFNLKYSKLMNSIDNIEFASNVDSLDDNSDDLQSDFDCFDFEFCKFFEEINSFQSNKPSNNSIPIYIQNYLLTPNLVKYTAPPQLLIG